MRLFIDTSNSDITIVGFDICPIMREIAKRKGMKVWGEVKISQQPHNSIDAAFSSYVFHLIVEDEFLQTLFNLLKPGGVLVANFHKNQGRDWIDQHLSNLGFKISIPYKSNNKYHGSYVTYIKPK